MTTYKDEARRHFLKSVGAAGLGALAGGSAIDVAFAADSRQVLKVRIADTAGNLTMVLQYMLKEKGYFQRFGLNADILNVSDGVKVAGALISGDVDACMISGFSPLLPAIERGGALKVLCGAGTRVGQCLYSKRADIRELKDLVGRTVGVGAIGALLHEITVAMLRKHGIDEKKVTFVNIGSSADVWRAIVAGTVDCGSAEIDNYPSQAQYGVHALTDGKAWEQIPEYTWQAGFTADRAIAQKRDALVRVLASFGALYRFLIGPDSFEAYRRARLLALGAKKDNLAEAQFFWNFAQQYKGFAYNLTLSKEQIDYVQKLNLSLGVQKKLLPFEQVADMSIATDALKLLGGRI